MRVCSKCKRDETTTEFYNSKKYSCCRECHRIVVKQWQVSNKDKVKEWRKQHVEKLRVLIVAKKQSGCKYCQEKRIECLDLHHTVDKLFELSTIKAKIPSVNQVIDELAKCDVVCANCHRLLHAGKI